MIREHSHRTVPSPRLVCRHDDNHWPARLTVIGDIDLATADQFAAALRQAIGRTPDLVVDMRDLTFIGVVGVRELCAQRDGIAGILVDEFMFRLLTVTGVALAYDLPIMTRDVHRD